MLGLCAVAAPESLPSLQRMYSICHIHVFLFVCCFFVLSFFSFFFFVFVFDRATSKRDGLVWKRFRVVFWVGLFF